MMSRDENFELIMDWMKENLEPFDVSYVRKRGIDIRPLVRNNMDKFNRFFVKSGMALLLIISLAILWFVSAKSIASEGGADWKTIAVTVLVLVVANYISFYGLKFQSRHTFDRVEGRMKNRNDLSLQYLLKYVSKDIALMQQEENRKRKLSQ